MTSSVPYVMERHDHAETRQPTRLLAESKDDKNWFNALTKHLSFDAFQIHDYGGVDQLRRFLMGFAKLPVFPAVTGFSIVQDS